MGNFGVENSTTEFKRQLRSANSVMRWKRRLSPFSIRPKAVIFTSVLMTMVK